MKMTAGDIAAVPAENERDRQAEAAATRDVYRRHARAWDAERSRALFEKPWLDRLADSLPPGGSVLDLGCGAGDPIGLYLAGLGLRVTGLDSAEEMIGIARARLPQARWIVGDMRRLQLEERFHAIVGWDSFFHLTPDEQRALLPRLVEHLQPGGGLLLTVGPAAGEPVGSVAGQPVYHASLAPEEYAARLAASGAGIVEFVPDDPACAGHTVLLARRREA
ncbi:class I SAM-dependent methyltransferase [Alsobacter sp. R-9]